MNANSFDENRLMYCDSEPSALQYASMLEERTLPPQ
jgi:hypothetical protein